MLQVKTPRVTIQDDAALSICTISQPVADHGAFASNLRIDRLHRAGLPNPPTSHALEINVIARRSGRRRRRPALSPAA